MKNRISPKERLAQLRSEAEAREQKLDAGTSRLPSAQDALVHDLQVHQLELEMQNEQLFTTQELLHESLEKYADLYNFAPVGYITLDRDGLILETNPTFSSQIDLNRADLINTPLGGYLAGEDRGRLHAHLDEVFATEGRQTCELRLEKPKGSILYIQLTSIAVKKDDGSQLCRTSVTDISIRRGVEKKLVNNEENIQFRAKDSDPAGQFCYTLIYDRAALSLDCPISRCFASGQREVAVANYQGAVLDLRAFPILEWP